MVKILKQSHWAVYANHILCFRGDLTYFKIWVQIWNYGTRRKEKEIEGTTLSGLWVALSLVEENDSPVGDEIFPFLCSDFKRSRKNWQQKRHCEPVIKCRELCCSKPDKYKGSQAAVQMHCLGMNFTVIQLICQITGMNVKSYCSPQS